MPLSSLLLLNLHIEANRVNNLGRCEGFVPLSSLLLFF